MFIEPGSLWENGYIQLYNGKMRDELLDPEIFFTLEAAKTLIARWREEHHHVRPHSALHYRPPHHRPGCLLHSWLKHHV